MLGRKDETRHHGDEHAEIRSGDEQLFVVAEKPEFSLSRSLVWNTCSKCKGRRFRR